MPNVMVALPNIVTLPGTGQLLKYICWKTAVLCETKH